MKRQELIFCLMFVLLVAAPAFADWSLPVTVSSGNVNTSITFGISAGATNGFDPGLDAPAPFTDGSINVYFPHSGWNVVIAGDPTPNFYRDIRGTVPQDFYFELKSSLSPVTFNWDPNLLPGKLLYSLYDQQTGLWVDMVKQRQYTLNASGTMSYIVRVSHGDTTPPSRPSNINVTEGNTYLYFSWAPNNESDLAGYKIHFGPQSGTYARTIDLRDVHNYTLKRLDSATTYYVALTAYDKSGNQSQYSVELTARAKGLDIVPPAGNVIINSNNSHTNTASVALALTASDDRPGDIEMCVSNVPACPPSSWEPYTSSKAWLLTPGDGAKTVYVHYSDMEGNKAVFSAGIVLDTVYPASSASPASGTLGPGAYVTLRATEPAFVYYTLDGSSPTHNSSRYLTPVFITANTTLKYYAEDLAGNAENINVSSYIVDNVPPSGNLTIDSGATTTAATGVTLAINCLSLDCTLMALSSDSVNWSPSEPYTAAKAYSITPGDGVKAVYVKLSDQYGNWSSAYGASIVLQTQSQAPVSNTAQNTGGQSSGGQSTQTGQATTSPVTTAPATTAQNTGGLSTGGQSTEAGQATTSPATTAQTTGRQNTVTVLSQAPSSASSTNPAGSISPAAQNSVAQNSVTSAASNPQEDSTQTQALAGGWGVLVSTMSPAQKTVVSDDNTLSYGDAMYDQDGQGGKAQPIRYGFKKGEVAGPSGLVRHGFGKKRISCALVDSGANATVVECSTAAGGRKSNAMDYVKIIKGGKSKKEHRKGGGYYSLFKDAAAIGRLLSSFGGKLEPAALFSFASGYKARGRVPAKGFNSGNAKVVLSARLFVNMRESLFHGLTGN